MLKPCFLVLSIRFRGRVMLTVFFQQSFRTRVRFVRFIHSYSFSSVSIKIITRYKEEKAAPVIASPTGRRIPPALSCRISDTNASSRQREPYVFVFVGFFMDLLRCIEDASNKAIK